MEKSKNRITIINIVLSVCLLAVVGCDFWLSRYGKKTLIFKANLPQGITIKYDNLQGYKFLEDGFIHILDERTIHGEDTIAAILAYHATESDVFVKSRTVSGKNIYLVIHVLESSNHELKYQLMEYKSIGDEDWTDISAKRIILLVVTTRNMLVGIMFILFLTKLFGWIRSAF